MNNRDNFSKQEADLDFSSQLQNLIPKILAAYFEHADEAFIDKIETLCELVLTQYFDGEIHPQLEPLLKLFDEKKYISLINKLLVEKLLKELSRINNQPNKKSEEDNAARAYYSDLNKSIYFRPFQLLAWGLFLKVNGEKCLTLVAQSMLHYSLIQWYALTQALIFSGFTSLRLSSCSLDGATEVFWESLVAMINQSNLKKLELFESKVDIERLREIQNKIQALIITDDDNINKELENIFLVNSKNTLVGCIRYSIFNKWNYHLTKSETQFSLESENDKLAITEAQAKMLGYEDDKSYILGSTTKFSSSGA